ncbi:hypothetical protein EJB05_08684, partial [Eragrostis curvula]
MEAATKRAHSGGGSAARDRPSALPDDLLLCVLSFLPTRQVVQTTVLSKRWVDPWRSVPAINLHIDFVWKKMKDFTINLLMLHNAECLDMFNFKLAFVFSDTNTRQDADRLIRHAIKHNPLVLDAVLNLDKELDELPIFDNLRTLSLNNCFYSKCDMHKFKALGRLLHKCPILEKLILKGFWVKPVIGPIEFPMLQNLRTLFLDECDLRDKYRLLRHFLENTPNLEKPTIRICKASVSVQAALRDLKQEAQLWCYAGARSLKELGLGRLLSYG